MQKKVRKLYGKTGRGTFLGSSRVKWAKQNKWQSWVINFYWCSECRSTFFTIYWNWKTLKGSVYAGGHGWTWNLHVCQNAWHVMGYWPPSKSKPPNRVNFLLPPSNWKWLLLHFSHMATSNKQYFWSYYNWSNAVIIDF